MLGKVRALDAKSTLTKLLGRGDRVSINEGRLRIVPASGNPVPDEWLSTHGEAISSLIFCLAAIKPYFYDIYTTGNYQVAGNGKRVGGITLQFVCPDTGEAVYAIFNASLTRERNTKNGNAGAPLPKGRFTVTERHQFYKFWKATGLPLPKRLSAFHDCMGKLKGVAFSGAIHNGRFDTKTLKPVSLSDTQIRQLFLPKEAAKNTSVLPDNFPTSTRQLPDNYPTISRQEYPTRNKLQPSSDKAFNQTQIRDEESTVIRTKPTRMYGYTGGVLAPVSDPTQQSVEEWLADLERAENSFH